MKIDNNSNAQNVYSLGQFMRFIEYTTYITTYNRFTGTHKHYTAIPVRSNGALTVAATKTIISGYTVHMFICCA